MFIMFRVVYTYYSVLKICCLQEEIPYPLSSQLIFSSNPPPSRGQLLIHSPLQIYIFSTHNRFLT